MVTINLKELNNKSRKGLYVYIKKKKIKGNYYRYTADTAEMDALIQYYTDRFVKKKSKGFPRQYVKSYKQKIEGIKQKRTKITRQAEQYVSRIRKRGALETHIKQGISGTTFNKIHTIGNNEIELKKTELLKPIILDREILELVKAPENMEKIKLRFEHIVTFYEGDIPAATATKIGITPDRMLSEIKSITKRGETIGSKWAEKLKMKGYRVDQMIQGKHITHADAKTIFRKGK